MRSVPLLGWLLVLGACVAEHRALPGRYAFRTSALEGIGSSNVGDWRIAFDVDGTFHARLGPERSIHGVYRVDGDRVVIEDGAGSMSCGASGADYASAVYRWRRDGGTLTLDVERDECEARRETLAGRVLDALD